MCVCIYINTHTYICIFFCVTVKKEPTSLKETVIWFLLQNFPEYAATRITRTNQIVMITFLKDLWCFAVSVSAWRRYCQISSTSHKTLLSIQWNDSRFLYTFREAFDQNCVSAMCSWVIGCVHACAVLVFK